MSTKNKKKLSLIADLIEGTNYGEYLHTLGLLTAIFVGVSGILIAFVIYWVKLKCKSLNLNLSEKK